MIVWGGENGSTILGTGGVYNPSTDTWTATSSTGAPAARTQFTAVWSGSVMIVWGGTDAGPFDSGGRYNPTTNTWTTTSLTNVPQARFRHTAIWTGTRMIVWGGINGFNRLATGGIYDPGADTWVATNTGANLPTGRASHTAVWTGSRMIIWGGTSGAGSLFTGGLFDPAANAWTGATSMVNNPAERLDHTAVWTGSRMIVWGGTGSGDVVAAGKRYDPGTDTWTSVSMGAGILSARIGHADAWTGSELIVWGGWDGFNINTGGRYNPATDTWSFMSTTGAPTARISAMSVWTGSLFIVWGGTTTPAFSYFNTGARYDPSTDAWSPMTGTLAPSGRAFGAAVWTGNRMIIWGGRNSSTYFNTGSRYDPAGNSWSATNVGGATPTPRSLYEGAVYTGSEMIVWGGNDGASPTNTGGRYSAGTNTWIAITPTAGTPSNREKNGIAWTGTELIIWGGFSGSNVLNSGSRYTPSTNTWVPMTTVGGPSARQYPATIWTGDRLLIWGGDNANSALDTGAKYDPGTDSWSNIPVNGAPTPQNAPEAVWTGSQMMVLGGSSQVGMYCTCLSPIAYFHDNDGDSFGVPASPVNFCGPAPSGFSAVSTDCNDANPAIWGKPGEVTGLTFSFPSTLTWVSPTTGGTSAGMLYDTLRSPSPSNFSTGTTCIETDNGPNVTATDAGVPGAGQLFSYLIRAQNACPTNNIGTLGFRSSGAERTGRTCP
jgi:N-acetylneuraminic acid mutarotase